MPTNDDTPKLETLAGGTNLDLAAATDPADIQKEDILQVYDVSAGKHKAITVSAFMTALGLTPV